MAATKRLQKELADLTKADSPVFKNIVVDEGNILHWEGLLVPQNGPYSKGAYKISLQFAAEYPFKPPKVQFKTKMYHPNIDDQGNICVDILKPDVWKPATKIEQVVLSIASILDAPNFADPLVPEIAETYNTDNKKYLKNVEDYVKKYSEKRPK
eukprot:Colp12_sorted_trinity150504_noHs@13478